MVPEAVATVMVFLCEFKPRAAARSSSRTVMEAPVSRARWTWVVAPWWTRVTGRRMLGESGSKGNLTGGLRLATRPVQKEGEKKVNNF